MNTLTDTAHACHLDSFVLAEDFHQHVQGKLLSPRLWEIAQALKSHQNAVAIGVQLQLPAETVLSGLRKLEAAGLVSTYQIQCPWLQTEDVGSSLVSAERQASTTTPPALMNEQPAIKLALAPVIAVPGAKQAQAVQSEAPVLARPSTEPTQETAQVLVLPSPVSTQTEKSPQAETPARTSIKLSMAARARLTKQSPAVKQASEKPMEGTAQLYAQAPGAISLKLCASRKTPAQNRQETAVKSSITSVSAASTTASTQGKNLCWAIQPVLDALRLKAGGDPMVGQLLAYRVFLRIPKELLEAAGIRSVCLIEPDLVIRDQSLKRAIETALREVANISWPTAVSSAV